MKHRRGQNEVIRSILEVCQGEGEVKTNVVRHTNLNYRTVVPYIDALTKSELLEVVRGPVVLYRTTKKGKETLRLLKEVDVLMP